MEAIATRRLVVGALLAGAGAAALGGYYSMSDGDYDAILAELTRPLAENADARELIRYSTLAANSHNTQPWLFRIRDRAIDILPDLHRLTPIVDPDEHHLFVSLGCAAENLSLAAKARGHSGEVLFDSAAEARVSVDLAVGPREEIALFGAIPMRCCTRSLYDGSNISTEVLDRLTAVARIGGVEPIILVEKRKIEAVLALIIAGNSRQMDDPAFLHELKTWLRFNARALTTTRDGIYSASTGNPPLPSWLGPTMFDLTVSKDGENAKYTEQIRSSSGLAIFVAETNDKAGWVAAGRSFQRFALQATADGLKHAFVNQAVEVKDVRSQLQALLNLGERRPNLIVRFGRGPEMPRPLRRRVEDVLLPASA